MTPSSRSPIPCPSPCRRPGRSLATASAVLAICIVVATPLAARQPTDDARPLGPVAAAPLFGSTEPLVLRIETDLEQILEDREEENPEHEGRVFVREADGSESEWPAQVRTRGRFRLQSDTCEFPPIRLNFPKSAVEGGVFDGQDKIKLVTHCRDRYEEAVLREYLAYRIYNALTPESFQVRLARVTWVDTSGSEETVERLAFFIEMEEALAERLGGEVIADEVLEAGLHPARVTNDLAMRVNLFAYMVGNTDFSLYASTGAGLHNIVPVELEGGQVIPVPYDFDWTGLVNAPYARPDRSLGIRRVTDRVFRGLCRPGVDYPAVYASFQARHDAIHAEIATLDGVSDDGREEMLEFLHEFWDTLADPDRARSRIEESCRPA